MRSVNNGEGPDMTGKFERDSGFLFRPPWHWWWLV